MPEEPKPSDNSTTGEHDHHRRLDSSVDELLKLLPSLDWLVEKLDSEDFQPKTAEALPAPQAPFMAPAPKAQLKWPALFEPRLLGCSKGRVVALTSRGFGALVELDSLTAEPFALEGLVARSIVGSAWTADGLQLVTRAGTFLSCPGSPGEGLWICHAADLAALELPHGSAVLSASLADGKVALQLENLPGSVALFKHGAAGWSPTGLVHVPPNFKGRLGLALTANELLVTASNGDVLRRRLVDGRASLQPPTSTGQREFQAACVQPDGSLLRLALRRGSDQGSAWSPELLV